ncbi:MAG: hypothetical protein H6723_15150 [Sandaracinus sp.]|nr:hypothetical protein [Sandaracinus sp.]
MLVPRDPLGDVKLPRLELDPSYSPKELDAIAMSIGVALWASAAIGERRAKVVAAVERFMQSVFEELDASVVGGWRDSLDPMVFGDSDVPHDDPVVFPFYETENLGFDIVQEMADGFGVTGVDRIRWMREQYLRHLVWMTWFEGRSPEHDARIRSEIIRLSALVSRRSGEGWSSFRANLRASCPVVCSVLPVEVGVVARLFEPE